MTIANGKPLATAEIATDLGRWAARNRIRALHVFGIDVVFASNTKNEQVVVPQRFNDVVWSERMLGVAQAQYRAIRNKRTRCTELRIDFVAGVKPGAPGFELPAGEPVSTAA